MIKYVWLNIETGEFSNSWNEKLMEEVGGHDEVIEKVGVDSKWKMIRYECTTDPDFEFCDMMKVK